MNRTFVVKLFCASRLALCVLLCLTVVARAQQQRPIEFSGQQARSHWIRPARELHTKQTLDARSLFRQVTLQVIVGQSGRVESAKAIGGPKEFYAEAEKIGMEHVFKPFQKDGVSVRASVEDYVWVLPPVST